MARSVKEIAWLRANEPARHITIPVLRFGADSDGFYQTIPGSLLKSRPMDAVQQFRGLTAVPRPSNLIGLELCSWGYGAEYALAGDGASCGPYKSGPIHGRFSCNPRPDCSVCPLRHSR